ncbi:pyridoxamine 5'-phosphate oxidase family protein [Mycobacterium seoulense]|uniref:pyridoxamine 5'-phosphate oxidase family protein n=1 Tax=Mycobacterium seoulense TaxID=386911 RepID=UPI003CE735B7
MITRDVEASAVADLALSPARAALAVTIDDEILVLPASVNLDAPVDPAWSPRVVQVPEGCPDLADRNVVVVADDGPQWFRLRSLTVRGMAKAIGDHTYRVMPQRIVAWDYGALRQVATSPVAPPRQTPFAAADRADEVPAFRSPELAAALQTSRVMIVASRSLKGTPFAVPLWFVAHGGRIYTTTSASSWTVRNVVATSQVALLFGGEGRDDPGRLLVRGYARAVRGAPPAAVTARMAWRYYLRPEFATVELRHARLWALRLRYYLQSRAAYIVITPQTTTECRAP